MPNSRNRKKKKPVKKKKELSIDQIRKVMDKNSVAPAPIKLKYFQAEFEGPTDLSFEERLAALRKIGKDANEAFPAEYQKLKNWFEKYDQPKLLAFSFYYFITSLAGYDEEAVTGSLEFPPYYQELLQAFSLTLPRSYKPEPFSEEVRRFKDDLKTVGELNKLKHFNLPETIKTPEELPVHLLRTEMMMQTTAVRNWSYEHKMRAVTLDLASRISKDFKAIHEFDAVIFLQIIYKMTDEVQERINEHRLKTVEFLRQKDYNRMIDAYEAAFPVEKISPENRRKLWEMFRKDKKQLGAMFLMHSDYFLENLFTFDFETLEGYGDNQITAENLKEIFGKITLNFGALADHDIEHFILGNPVHEKPFIWIEDNAIFSSLWGVMTHLSLGLLEGFCAKDEKLRVKYNEVRADYLEAEIVNLFKVAFPMASIYKGSKWKGKDNREYENDLLVIIDKFALVVEAKAGQVSPPAKRGAPDRLSKTFKELIEDPSEQALRFIEFLQENPKELSLKVKKGSNNRFNAEPLTYFIPLGVTLSHLGMAGSNLKQLIKAGVTTKAIEELATSVSLTDLQIVFDILTLASEKIHYLQRRRELEASIEYVGDELDLLAWYLDNGFNFGPDEENIGFFKMDLKAKELDHYIIGNAKGEKVAKPELQKTKWWRDMLNRLEERQKQTWLETSYVLLNVPLDGQETFEELVNDMKNKMRKGSAEFPHNWIFLQTFEENRKFTIAGYGYHDRLKDERDGVMGDMLYNENMKDAKGKLVIGMNIDKTHYPYSVLGSWLSSDLFDNRYLKMLRKNESSEDEAQ
jgi:hypothetical protein